MSADNWRKCPKCLAKAKEEHENLLKRLESDYGKIPIDEFRELSYQAEMPIGDLDSELREDYDIEMNDDGELEIDYHCSCKCGFKFSYKNTVKAIN